MIDQLFKPFQATQKYENFIKSINLFELTAMQVKFVKCKINKFSVVVV